MNNLSINLNINEDLLINIHSKLDHSNNIENYVLNLINIDINSKINLNKDFYFDNEKKKIFSENNEIILTKIEYDLFKILFDNCNTIVTFEDIVSIVWKGKAVSKFSLRNYIKRLRTKIYPSLIKNYFNHGYEMVIN